VTDINGPLRAKLRIYERQLIVEALAANNWNITRTAKALGIHHPSLYNRMASLGISREQPPGE
jgi:DNA-binding NtrC family response regulator